MKAPSNILPLAPLMLGNVFPSELIGGIVRLNLARNPGHRCQHLNFQERPVSIHDIACRGRLALYMR
jgi:hypothetical protein